MSLKDRIFLALSGCLFLAGAALPWVTTVIGSTVESYKSVAEIPLYGVVTLPLIWMRPSQYTDLL